MRTRLRLLFFFLLASAIPSCGTSEKKVEYEPYAEEPAFPNRREKLPAPKGRFGYVSNNGSDTVTVLDLPANEVVAQMQVGRDPLGNDGPHHLAVDAAGNVFVALQYPAPTTLPGPHAAHASATRPGFVLKLAPDDLRVVGEVQIDANPGEIILSPDGRHLVATHFDLGRALDQSLDAPSQRAALAVIDPNAIIGSGSPAPVSIRTCRAPHGASFAADNRTVYVSCYADDTVAIVDVENATAPPVIVPTSCDGPYSAVLSGSGKAVAVGCTDSKTVRLLDTTSRAFREPGISVLGAPFFAAWSHDETKLWVPLQNPDLLVIVDASTGTVLTQRAFDKAACERPHEAVLSEDGSTVYLVCEGDHVNPSVVLALDSVSLETRATMTVGAYPDRLAVRPR